MNDETVAGVHWSFWPIGAVALIWNVMGDMNFETFDPKFVAHVKEIMSKSKSEARRDER